PGWHDYLDEMYRHVWSKDFWSKEVYLGVRLGQRGMRAQMSGGVIAQFLNLYRAGEQAMGLDDEAVRDRKSTRLNSSHLGISYADSPLPSFPTRRSSDLPAGTTTSTRCTGTCGPRTSGPRRSTSASGWASAACARRCPAGSSPSS